MKEIITDQWQMLLPEEWFAEQEDETIIIMDEDEVSCVEITTLLPDAGSDTQTMLQSLVSENSCFKTALAEMDAYYHEQEDDGMFWREWFCDAEDFVLIVSHGCELENRGMDDSAVDEMLSTLLIMEDEA